MPSPALPEVLDLPESGQLEFTGRMLNGSQAKTAFALRLNCEAMICGNAPRRLERRTLETGKSVTLFVCDAPENLNSTAFLTLTVGDEVTEPDGARRFQQVFDAAEASRRINNLNRRVLAHLFERAVVVTERHKSGAIHFHVLGVLRGRPDIRSGFNWPAFLAARRAGRRFSASAVGASDDLSARWQLLRTLLPRYGFGRSELTPVQKSGEAVASYVSKYIEKNVCNRLKADKGKKLVRYLGWGGAQLKPNSFSWAGVRASAWRAKTRQTAALVGVTERDQCSQAFGPRWAWAIAERVWKPCGQENLSPTLSRDALPSMLEAVRRIVRPSWRWPVRKCQGRRTSAEFAEVALDWRLKLGLVVCAPDLPEPVRAVETVSEFAERFARRLRRARESRLDAEGSDIHCLAPC